MATLSTSWVRLDKALSKLDKIVAGSSLYQLTHAFVGMEAATAFNDFINSYNFQVTIEDILDDGKFDLIKEWKNNDHLALIEKMKAKEIFNSPLSDTRLKNLADYFVTLPSEIAMTIWTAIGKAKCAENITGFHGSTTSDGQKVNLHIVKLMNGK